MILGVVGSFLPVLPGPLTSWIGLLVVYFMPKIDVSFTTLIVTLIIAAFSCAPKVLLLGAPIINLGIGSPDLAPPKSVISAITNSLKDASAHKYQSYQGLPELRSAMADFYQTNYNVSLNPENEVLPLIGSKEGIMHISLAFLNPLISTNSFGSNRC